VFVASLHFHEREILSDQNQYEKAQEERRGKLERGGRERVLPTRDQHRREIASNLWVRLITRECSSFDSPLFLRPQLHQTSFQRWEESLLLPRHLFLYRLNSSLLAPLCERLCVWTCILILRLLYCMLITSFFFAKWSIYLDISIRGRIWCIWYAFYRKYTHINISII